MWECSFWIVLLNASTIHMYIKNSISEYWLVTICIFSLNPGGFLSLKKGYLTLNKVQRSSRNSLSSRLTCSVGSVKPRSDNKKWWASSFCHIWNNVLIVHENWECEQHLLNVFSKWPMQTTADDDVCWLCKDNQYSILKNKRNFLS